MDNTKTKLSCQAVCEPEDKNGCMRPIHLQLWGCGRNTSAEQKEKRMVSQGVETRSPTSPKFPHWPVSRSTSCFNHSRMRRLLKVHGEWGEPLAWQIKRQWQHFHPILYYLGLIPGSVPDSSFLLMQTPEGSADDWIDQVPAAHVGDVDCIPRFWLCPGPVPDTVGFGEVNQQMGALSFSVSASQTNT